MEKHFYSTSGLPVRDLSLHEFFNRLIQHMLPYAVEKGTVIINNTGKDIFLDSGNQAVLDLLQRLLSAFIQNSKQGDICLSTDRYRDHILLHLEERNNYNGYALEYSITACEQDARRIGGFILLKDPTKRLVTLTVGIPDSRPLSGKMHEKTRPFWPGYISQFS